mmetsp:Transcript_111180/g.321390  ORF Transcript_111180/g.321390 Transcript_111180/m.321390 type:complete len:377 (+) Transcript_111180:89-1219(+)
MAVGAPMALLAALVALLGAPAAAVVHVRRRTPRYLFATFPNTPEVGYSMLPHEAWSPLIIEGLAMPEAISVDADNQRIFVADTMAKLILAYQFRILPSGRLLVDGPRHVLSERMVGRGLLTDATGTLYIAGQQEPDPATVPPGTAIEPLEAVFVLATQDIDQVIATGVPIDPKSLWLRRNTAGGSSATSPQLYAPSCLAGDAVTLFWGNSARPDAATGAIASAGTAVPALQPEETVRAMADNVDRVSAVALTPTYVFYAGSGKIFGVSRHKASGTCGEGGSLCPAVLKQDGADLRPSSMVWDGDGTVYVADATLGAVLSFSAGSLSTHIMSKVADASGVWGIAYYVPTSRAAPGRGLGAALALLAAAMASVWGPSR